MPVSDIRVYAGAADGWISLKGSNGAPGPSAVSANAGQLAKLGSDNLILVSSADLDARYVNVTGDNMTGTLALNSATPATEAAAAKLVVVGPNKSVASLAETNTNAVVSIRPNVASGFTLAIGSTLPGNNPYLQGVQFNGGTSSAPLSIQPYGGSVGIGKAATPTVMLDVAGAISGTAVTATGGRSSFTPVDEAFAIGVRYNAAGTVNYIGTNAAGALQISSAGGAGMMTIASTGNITSPGTAHSFAAKSIPVSAINGLPTLAANDLTDVTVATPATGQVLRYDGTNFVNTKLNFSDLSGTIVNPTINAPSISSAFALLQGQPEAYKFCVVLSTAPVASATITGVQGYYYSTSGYATTPEALVLGKVNTVTGVFIGGIATYSGWVSMVLGPDERHACVYPSGGGGSASTNTFLIRFYTPTENSNWSNGVYGLYVFTGQTNTITGRFRRITASYTLFADDADDTIANVSTGTTPVVITIPANSTAVLPVGTRLDILDMSATSTTTLQAAAGVTLVWSSAMTSPATVPAIISGGVAAAIQLASPISKVVLYKTDTDSWAAFS